jgi:hypothetical protein
MENLVAPFILFICSVIVVYGICISPFRTTIIKQKCTCGQEKKWCASYLYSGGSVLIGRKNRFACKKERDALIELSNHPVMKRIQKEIKEKGSSCPENW